MNQAKQRRRTWIVLASAVLIVVAGIVYLVVNTDPNAIVDVRSIGEFADSRIPGAVSIPLADIAGNEPNVDKGALIYTYCT